MSESSRTVPELGDEEWDPVEERIAVEALQRKLFGETPQEVRVGRYHLHDRIAYGGMGVVYRAHDPTLERDVAVKLIRANREGSARAHARLLAEAKALAGVSHPNVVEVYDSGSFDVAEVFGTGEGMGVFVVMAFIEGQTLGDWLETPRRWKEVLAPLIAAGVGLAAIHDAGLVHRDFKPSNVLMGTPVRIVDFGLATEFDAAPSDLEVAGTPGYMAPEQFEGHYSPKSDQYAFCASLWKALYGVSPPPVEESTAQTWRRPPNSRVPRWLHATVERGLHADPDARHPDMTALLFALRRDSRQRAKWGALAVGLGVATTVGFLAGRDPDPRCVDRPLGGAWDAKTSDEIRAQFLASGLAFAPSAFEDLQTYLDRFVAEWEVARRETCALEPSQAREETFACLQRKELGTLGLLEIYREPDPILIERAAASLDGMQPPSDCIESAPDPRPALKPNADLERAHVFLALGRNGRAREALDRADRVVVDPRQRAEIMSLRCDLAGDEGRAGLEVCTMAWKAAERAGLNRMAAQRLLVVAQYRVEFDYDSAWEAVAIAEAKIASMSSATSLRLRAATVHAEVLALKDPERAVTLLRANIEAKEVFYGASTIRTVHDRLTLASLLEELGRFQEARDVYDVTQARVVERLGARHPHIAAMLNNRAGLEFLAGRYEDARVLYTEALELKLATPGWNTTRTASTHANLARLYDVSLEPELSEHHARAAIAAGGEHPSSYVSATLVRVLRHAGKASEAQRVARAGREASPRRLDDDLAVELALAELALGGAPEAHKILLELIARFEAEPWPIGEKPFILAALAQTEVALGLTDAALDTAQRAGEAFAASPLRPAEWAQASAELGDALQAVAPKRASEVRARARQLQAKYAPVRSP